MNELKLPELGEGIEKAVVACWHVKQGDQVNQDDDILEVVTDKATFNVPAHKAGVVAKICVKEGDDAIVGETVAIIN